MAYSRKAPRRRAAPRRSSRRASPRRSSARGRSTNHGILRLVVESAPARGPIAAPLHLGPGGGLVPISGRVISGKAKF